MKISFSWEKWFQKQTSLLNTNQAVKKERGKDFIFSLEIIKPLLQPSVCVVEMVKMESAHLTIKRNVIIWIWIISFYTFDFMTTIFYYYISIFNFFFSGQSSLLWYNVVHWMALCLATSTGTIKNIICCMNYVHKVYIELFWHIMFLFFTYSSPWTSVHSATCSGWLGRHDFLSILAHFIILNGGAGISNLLNLQPIISYLLCWFITLVIMVKYDSRTFSFYFITAWMLNVVPFMVCSPHS